MSHRTSTSIRNITLSENAAPKSPLHASKENVNANSTPKQQRKPLGDKSSNNTPSKIIEPRVGHRAEKHTDKFASVRLPEPLHLSPRSTTKQQQHHRKLALRGTEGKKNASRSHTASVASKSNPSKNDPRHPKPPPVKVPSPDGAFSIWVDDRKQDDNKKKNENIKTKRVEDQENVLPSKPTVVPTRARTQRVHQPSAERKKMTRKPLTEIDVHALPEYRDLLRDSSPTPAAPHNVSSSSLRSPTWSDSEAVLSQALEQAETTARSLLSEIRHQKDDTEDEKEDPVPKQAAPKVASSKEAASEDPVVPSHDIVPQPAQDMLNVVNRNVIKAKVTRTTNITTTTEIMTLHKRRSDETDSHELIANINEDSIKKRLRPRRR